MPNVNRVIGASQPFLNADGTVASPWFRFLEAIANRSDEPAPAPITYGPMTPYFIPAGESFTVPINRQALFDMAIDNEGILDVDGYLLEVD